MNMTINQIIINSTISETRVAVLSDHKLSELYIEDASQKGIVSNIYKGVVTRVLPGMNSAFVNIGQAKPGFLFGGDVIDPKIIETLKESQTDHTDIKPKNTLPIEKFLSEGQEITVQVAKEALSTKGPRLTQIITVPGRYLVLMPSFNYIGISRRIDSPIERARLKSIVSEVQKDGLGIIIRTAAQGINADELIEDYVKLLKTLEDIEIQKSHVSAPGILYEDLTISQKLIRDLYSEDISEIICDNSEIYSSLKEFIDHNAPSASDKIRYYNAPVPVFEAFSIEAEITKALEKKVSLISGGHIIIEQTEALTSIDVNTGKYTGKGDARHTILQTNLEAVSQIVRQLRIRNIGGIIIVDFIDMESPIDRESVYNALIEELKKDRARTNVLRISELGLVQMTRKRTSESLSRRYMQPCPYCSGTGLVKTCKSEALDLIRTIVKVAEEKNSLSVSVRARQDILEYLLKDYHDVFQAMILDKKIQVQFEPGIASMEQVKSKSFEVF